MRHYPVELYRSMFTLLVLRKTVEVLICAAARRGKMLGSGTLGFPSYQEPNRLKASAHLRQSWLQGVGPSTAIPCREAEPRNNYRIQAAVCHLQGRSDIHGNPGPVAVAGAVDITFRLSWHEDAQISMELNSLIGRIIAMQSNQHRL